MWGAIMTKEFSSELRKLIAGFIVSAEETNLVPTLKDIEHSLEDELNSVRYMVDDLEVQS